jgi:hypothetical protein
VAEPEVPRPGHAYMRTPLTEEQAYDLRICYQEWLVIRQKNGLGPPSAADIYKGALLGRMTIDGLPPHFSPPPRHYARPWWELIENNRADLPEHAVSVNNDQASICGDRWVVTVIGGDYYYLSHDRLSGIWELRHRRPDDPLVRKGSRLVDIGTQGMKVAEPVYYGPSDWVLVGP